MKTLALMTAALVLGLTLVTSDAEAAKRFGGGSSTGMQRQSVAPAPAKSPAATPAQTPAAPSQAAAPTSAPAAAAAGAAQPKRSWMGPLAGLAAGIGLAALASHFGFGEQLANMLMIGLLVMVVLAVIGFIMRKKAGTQPAMAGAAPAPTPYGSAFERLDPAPQTGIAPAGLTPASSGNVPADFDAAGFVRQAKVNFIRLQTANDAGNLDDIRQFTTPELFAEVKMQHAERGGATQETEVVQLEATVLDVSEEDQRYVVSVRFYGLLREEKNGPAESFDEMWHLVKPRNGASGWMVAGIQQLQ